MLVAVADESELVTAIKKLRQRGGIHRERKNFPLELFGASDWEDLKDIIITCTYNSSSLDVTFYLSNALAFGPWGGDEPHTSVIQRRESITEFQGLSVRTIERREQVGAEILADQIQKTVLQPNLHSLFDDALTALDSAVWSAKRVGYECDQHKVDEAHKLLRELQSAAFREFDEPRMYQRMSEQGESP